MKNVCVSMKPHGGNSLSQNEFDAKKALNAKLAEKSIAKGKNV